MFSYPLFDVEIVRDLRGAGLRWPESAEAGSDRNLGCNREYLDLRGMDWDEAQRVYDLEMELIGRIETAQEPDEEYDAIQNELYEDPDDGLFGLDLGVASSVIALSAAGCVPFSSCSGGAFGGHHHERHPLVAFFAKQKAVAMLLACAEESGTGLEAEDTGALVLYANDIRAMLRFAKALIES
jgi:hypothetical protein